MVDELDLPHDGALAQDVLEDHLKDLLIEASKPSDKHPFSKVDLLRICKLALEESAWGPHVDDTLMNTCNKGNVRLFVPLSWHGDHLENPQLADMFITIDLDGYVTYRNHSDCTFKYSNALEIYKIIVEVLGD